MFTVDKLKQAESSGSLIADPWPPGFEDGGRRVLAKCDEMTLYELYRPGGEQEVVLAPEIERILWRHLFRINDIRFGISARTATAGSRWPWR